MSQTPAQILEVRAGDGARPVTITLALSAEASQASVTALSEQLDRRRREPTTSPEDVLALREQTALVERLEPLAGAAAHGMISLSPAELRTCLLELTAYAERMDGEHFQPIELRERLGVIAGIVPVLWDANASAAAVAETSLGHPAL